MSDTDEGAIDANAMLLAFCSDFFEAALRKEWKEAGADVVRIRLREVSAEDVAALVEHSEGRGAGWEPPTSPLWREDLERLLRIQGRFAMPQLREACAAALREHASTDSDWTSPARAAADHFMWDVVADALVLASNPPWRSLGELWSPDGVADDLLLRRNLAPQACVARVLRLASFPYHGQRVALASRWWAASLDAADDDLVVRALVETSAVYPLWLPEIDGLVLHGDDGHAGLPSEVLSALVKCLARTVSPACPRPRTTPVAELRRGMAMIEATLEATAGPGLYQMALVPIDADNRLEIDLAYVSNPVRMQAASAVYHVYLEEETRLQAWWRLHGGAALHVLFASWV